MRERIEKEDSQTESTMTTNTASQTSFLEHDRVRVGRVESSVNWWFATVLSVNGNEASVRLQCKENEPVARTYPLDQVRAIDGKFREWMIGLTVSIPSKKQKSKTEGIVVDVIDRISIEYAPSVLEKRPLKGVIDHLYASAKNFSFDSMPWNIAYQGPEITKGTEIYKEFKGECTRINIKRNTAPSSRPSFCV
jgi:hypothetical protein